MLQSVHWIILRRQCSQERQYKESNNVSTQNTDDSNLRQEAKSFLQIPTYLAPVLKANLLYYACFFSRYGRKKGA